MMHEVASHGGGMAAASSVHINLFGPHPIVVYGTPEQKPRWMPRLIAGQDQVAFGFTEPDAGLNTTRIKTFAAKGGRRLHRQRPEGVDLDGAGRQQDHAADAHDAVRGLRTADRRHHASSTPTSTARRSRSAGSPRWAARRSTRSHLHRRPVRAGRGPDRRGGQGLLLHPAQPQSGADPDRRRRRSASARTRCAARPATPGSGSCSTGRSARTRGSSIRWPSDGCISRAAWLMAMRAA